MTTVIILNVVEAVVGFPGDQLVVRRAIPTAAIGRLVKRLAEQDHSLRAEI
jgi:hypothetical protein